MTVAPWSDRHGVAARDASALAEVTRFAATLDRVSWFAGVGQDLTDGEAREAADYLAALGFADARVSLVRGWRDAEAVTRDPNWDNAWWTAEERLRTDLLARAERRWGDPTLMAALTRVTDAATRVTLGAASTAASRDGIADPALARVAAGAATQAAYQAALALAMDAGEAHPFAIKFRLFAAGRWLLGSVGGRFFVF
ncbi:MAG TPA: hypothetical protein VGB82_25435 [Alphaproteobacteria bacterium]